MVARAVGAVLTLLVLTSLSSNPSSSQLEQLSSEYDPGLIDAMHRRRRRPKESASPSDESREGGVVDGGMGMLLVVPRLASSDSGQMEPESGRVWCSG